MMEENDFKEEEEIEDEEEGGLFTLKRVSFGLYYFVASSIAVALLCDFAYSSKVGGYGRPEILSCRNWLHRGWASCGLNGVNCLPFENVSFAVRCPGRCDWPGTDGPYEFYGDNIRGYHPISRICPAAIHAGVLTGNGGCAVVRYNGAVSSFESSKRNGVSSKEILAPYFKSFVFETDVNSESCYGTTQQYGACMFVSAILLAGSTCFPSMFRPPTWILVSQSVVFGTFYLAMTFYLSDYSNGSESFTSALGCLTALSTLLFAMWHYYEWGDEGRNNPFRMMDETLEARHSIKEDQIMHFHENDNDQEASSKVESIIEISSVKNKENNNQITRHFHAFVKMFRQDSPHRRRVMYICVFVPCFFMGLHFSLLSYIPGFDVDLSQNQGTESSSKTGQTIAIILLSLLLLGLLSYFGRLSYRQGTLKRKILFLLGLALMILATRFMFLSSNGDTSFHLHHTTSGILVMSLCKFRNTASLVIASIFLGVIVDGIVKWSEWNWFDTWTVSSTQTQYLNDGPDIPNVLNWTSPELQLHVSNISNTSVNITFPSENVMESLLGVQVMATVILMNFEPVAQLIYEHVKGTTSLSCGSRCSITKEGLFPGSEYTFYFGCILSNGMYAFNPYLVGWETPS